MGVAAVPDDRLERAGRACLEAQKVVPATVEFVDIGGLVEGASKGEGLGNRFLAGIREVDAVVYVLRAFADADVPGPTDPLEHLGVVETELASPTSSRSEEQVERPQASAAKVDKSLTAEVDADGRRVRRAVRGHAAVPSSDLGIEHRALAPWFLLTNKPVLAVVNIGEDRSRGETSSADPARGGGRPPRSFPCRVQLEAEAAQLPAEDRPSCCRSSGWARAPCPALRAAAYHLLGRWTFLTTGDKECGRGRSWPAGGRRSAPGGIHTDIQRGFIKAESSAGTALVELGSWAKAGQAGKVRIEGKDYEVQDGDVLEIRFNVCEARVPWLLRDEEVLGIASRSATSRRLCRRKARLF